ncbi:iron ABC transporter [Formosimonas limnophila]|uniref:Iron ABC transporter n=1 Tax=Formosimonas limnophila TaxID=1384487 RepID=A0A8J3CMK0_9BURK|nr:iron ABC transporter permease [Formosimonas limnophila]GHA71011.1 iron ABC transporter [Formosimonas limnophila]
MNQLIPTSQNAQAQRLVRFVMLLSVLVAMVVVAFSLWFDARSLPMDVFISLRLPRVLAAFGVGGLLALSGVMLQVLLRNPLAEPYILGAASGASFCVLLGMLLGGAWWLLQGAALFGALSALAAMLWMMRRHARLEGDVTVLLLLGVLLAALLNAAVSAILLVLPDRVMRGALFWMLGDLAGSGQFYAAWFGVWLCLIATMLLAQPMAALMRGAVMAHSIGVNVSRVRVQLLLLSGLATALAVMEAGAIGFVGLIVPHVVKAVGARHFATNMRVVLPLCALWGGILLVVADWLARTLFAPLQLPVGLFTVALGAPLLAWRLIKRMQGGSA